MRSLCPVPPRSAGLPGGSSIGVSSRIVRLNSGEEIVAHVKELAAHFARDGTPIMIGGGVLAYTLLGVAFSDRPDSQPRLLILDPHYTGAPNNLKAIKDKGAVSSSSPVACVDRSPGGQAGAAGRTGPTSSRRAPSTTFACRSGPSRYEPARKRVHALPTANF